MVLLLPLPVVTALNVIFPPVLSKEKVVRAEPVNWAFSRLLAPDPPAKLKVPLILEAVIPAELLLVVTERLDSEPESARLIWAVLSVVVVRMRLAALVVIEEAVVPFHPIPLAEDKVRVLAVMVPGVEPLAI